MNDDAIRFAVLKELRLAAFVFLSGLVHEVPWRIILVRTIDLISVGVWSGALVCLMSETPKSPSSYRSPHGIVGGGLPRVLLGNDILFYDDRDELMMGGWAPGG